MLEGKLEDLVVKLLVNNSVVLRATMRYLLQKHYTAQRKDACDALDGCRMFSDDTVHPVYGTPYTGCTVYGYIVPSPSRCSHARVMPEQYDLSNVFLCSMSCFCRHVLGII